jgi:hypothetical protein
MSSKGVGKGKSGGGRVGKAPGGPSDRVTRNNGMVGDIGQRSVSVPRGSNAVLANSVANTESVNNFLASDLAEFSASGPGLQVQNELLRELGYIPDEERFLGEEESGNVSSDEGKVEEEADRLRELLESKKRKEREQLERLDEDLVVTEKAKSDLEMRARTLRVKRDELASLMEGERCFSGGNEFPVPNVNRGSSSTLYNLSRITNHADVNISSIPGGRRDSERQLNLGNNEPAGRVVGLSGEELLEIRDMMNKNKMVVEKGRYSKEFLDSIKKHDFDARVVSASNGSVGFDLLDTDGRVFESALLKLDNGILIQLAKGLFVSRLMVKDRTDKFLLTAGVGMESVAITTFVSNSLQQFASSRTIKDSFKSLSNLQEFAKSHILMKNKSGCYFVIEQFMKGEYSATSLFRINENTDFSVSLNIFSLSDPPYPSCEAQVSMAKCVELVRRWEKFLDILCWVPSSCECQWSDVFKGLIRSLEWGNEKVMDPFFFLDALNNVLTDWFLEVKAPFYIEGVKFSFNVHISAMLLLKDLLGTIVLSNQASAIYAARKRLYNTLICFEGNRVGSVIGVPTPLGKSPNVCFHYLCTKLLSIDAPVGYSCRTPNCTFLHPTLAELPSVKSAVCTFMSLKSIDKSIQTAVLDQIEKISVGVP